jgi:peptidoglycan/LPS O-acetylase OafA/YrhL
VIVVFLLAIILLIALLIRKKKYHLFYGSMPLIAATGYLMTACGNYTTIFTYSAAMLFNAYLFVLGLASLVRGIWDRRLGAVNGGMLILILLIITRFFDSEFGLLAKGGVFIVLGAIFLAVNLTFRKFKGRGG